MNNNKKKFRPFKSKRNIHKKGGKLAIPRFHLFRPHQLPYKNDQAKEDIIKKERKKERKKGKYCKLANLTKQSSQRLIYVEKIPKYYKFV